MVHRAGTENTNADCLSRNPLPSKAASPIPDWSRGEVLPVTLYLASWRGPRRMRCRERRLRRSGRIGRSCASYKLRSMEPARVQERGTVSTGVLRTTALLEGVLSRYGAPAEVLTD